MVQADVIDVEISTFQGEKCLACVDPIDPSPKWRPKIQISQNKLKRIPALERTPLLK